MKFDVDKIMPIEESQPPKLEISVSFREEKPSFNQNGNVRVYLEDKNQTVSEIKTEAVEAAKEFLKNAIAG